MAGLTVLLIDMATIREVQFFSQLGYNVIQVNFRGSGGFGRKFEEAGYLNGAAK